MACVLLICTEHPCPDVVPSASLLSLLVPLLWMVVTGEEKHFLLKTDSRSHRALQILILPTSLRGEPPCCRLRVLGLRAEQRDAVLCMGLQQFRASDLQMLLLLQTEQFCAILCGNRGFLSLLPMLLPALHLVLWCSLGPSHQGLPAEGSSTAALSLCSQGRAFTLTHVMCIAACTLQQRFCVVCIACTLQQRACVMCNACS